MKISNRIKSMRFSSIRKLTPFSAAAKENGVKVYYLNIGQPDIETPETFFKGIENYNEKVLKYSNSQGIDNLIESFIKYYKEWNIEFDRNQIMITNGGSEALLFALMTICDDGDEVVVPEPFYTNYNSFAHLSGAKISPFVTKAEDGFHLPSREEITKEITDKTRAILMSNPGNPTGVVYTYDEIRMLADIVKKYDLYLIADEVYREFVYDNLEFTSALSMEDILDRVILIDSISKRYSACGARIGLVASKNDEFMNQILKLCQSRLSVSTIDQFAAANLINTPKKYFEDVKAEYEKRRDIVFDSLSKIPGVFCKKPSGAFYIIAKLPVRNAEEFARWMLTDFNYQNRTVMVAPAQGFYSDSNRGIDEIRISYCINSHDLQDAIDILARGLKEFVNKH